MASYLAAEQLLRSPRGSDVALGVYHLAGIAAEGGGGGSEGGGEANAAALAVADSFKEGRNPAVRFSAARRVVESQGRWDLVENKNRTVVIEKIKSVLDSDDPTARAMACRMLGGMGPLGVGESLECLRALWGALDRSEQMESEAAVEALRQLCAGSRYCAESSLPRLIAKANSFSSAPELVQRVARCLEHMHHTKALACEAQKFGEELLQVPLSASIAITVAVSLTKLAKRAPTNLQVHTAVLESIATKEARARVRINALRCLTALIKPLSVVGLRLASLTDLLKPIADVDAHIAERESAAQLFHRIAVVTAKGMIQTIGAGDSFVTVIETLLIGSVQDGGGEGENLKLRRFCVTALLEFSASCKGNAFDPWMKDCRPLTVITTAGELISEIIREGGKLEGDLKRMKQLCSAILRASCAHECEVKACSMLLFLLDKLVAIVTAQDARRDHRISYVRILASCCKHLMSPAVAEANILDIEYLLQASKAAATKNTELWAICVSLYMEACCVLTLADASVMEAIVSFAENSICHDSEDGPWWMYVIGVNSLKHGICDGAADMLSLLTDKCFSEWNWFWLNGLVYIAEAGALLAECAEANCLAINLPMSESLYRQGARALRTAYSSCPPSLNCANISLLVTLVDLRLGQVCQCHNLARELIFLSSSPSLYEDRHPTVVLRELKVLGEACHCLAQEHDEFLSKLKLSSAVTPKDETILHETAIISAIFACIASALSNYVASTWPGGATCDQSNTKAAALSTRKSLSDRLIPLQGGRKHTSLSAKEVGDVNPNSTLAVAIDLLNAVDYLMEVKAAEATEEFWKEVLSGMLGLILRVVAKVPFRYPMSSLFTTTTRNVYKETDII